jgi:hypothetical protein
VGAFADSVDPSALTVLNQPNYVFLCGGRLDDFDHSLRAHFYRDRVRTNPTLSQRVQLAERADELYQSRKLFEDLLELEEHLAGLSACVLLFVESPGAIAEFGAFSQMELLQQKLVVVVEASHFRQQSFIRNGLVEHASRIRPDSVLSYPWLSSPTAGGPSTIDSAAVDGTLDEIEREIEKILTGRPKSAAFKKNDHGHLMLLIADLVALNVVILQHEIQELLSELGVAIKLQELKKYLFLLDQLSLLSASRYGNVDYYVNQTGATEYISYAPKAPTDRSRLRNLLRKDLPLSPEKNRALNAFTRRKTGATP